MNAGLTRNQTADPDEAAVRKLVVQLLKECPPSTTDPMQFLGRQFDLGLAWIHFPSGAGGLGSSPKLQKIVDDTMRAARAPDPARRNLIGHGMAASTIVTHGTPKHRERFLRPIFTGEEVWCQLFSEPGAGSDIASIATRAMRDGGNWIVNGQKVWTTGAHRARWGLLAARSDPSQPKHRGITYFVLDMQAPGVEVRPLYQITGDAEFNEVYLTDVLIPDDLRLGDEGRGWEVMLTTLMNERVALGAPLPPRGAGYIGELVELWRRCTVASPARRHRLAHLWIRAEVLRLTAMRAAQARARGNPGAESSIGKLASTELNKELSEFALELLGPAGSLYPEGYAGGRFEGAGRRPEPRQAFLLMRSGSIAGGTSEVLKNVLGEQVLGLPGDVRVDKDLPWSEVPR